MTPIISTTTPKEMPTARPTLEDCSGKFEG